MKAIKRVEIIISWICPLCKLDWETEKDADQCCGEEEKIT